MPRVLLAIALIAVVVYAAVDCFMSDARHVRGVPKTAWVAIILFLPLVGALLWFFAGRPNNAKAQPQRPQRRPVAPDDDPNFLRNLETRRRQEQKDAELKAREAELKAREERLREDGKDSK